MPDSKDIVKLGMGLVATMAALVLGLLVASAKGSYDAQSAELTQMSANIALLDRAWPCTDRRQRNSALCCATPLPVCSINFGLKTAPALPQRRQPSAGGEILYERIQGLSPKNATERSLQGQALSIAVDIGKTR